MDWGRRRRRCVEEEVVVLKIVGLACLLLEGGGGQGGEGRGGGIDFVQDFPSINGETCGNLLQRSTVSAGQGLPDWCARWRK